ncbi:MAG: SGNH/GDSL hydrolase family protein [Planctomycetota bacterium]
MPRNKPLPFLLVLAMLGMPRLSAEAQGNAYSDVVVFGDSLSDVGNTANNFFFQFISLFGGGADVTNGRFSSGPVWVEHLAADLGLPGSASSRSDAGGDNYAHGGARTGSGRLSFNVIDNLGFQIDDYLSSNTPAGDELFVVWGGGNDVLDGVGTAQSITTNMINHVGALADGGAQRFLVMNLPKLGDIPRNLGSASQPALNNLASSYNSLLAAEMNTLARQRGLDITLFDVETTFDRLLQDPTLYGFTNTSDAFVGSSGDVNGFVFWDEIHPTSRAHDILADAVFVALQVPGDLTGDGRVDEADLAVVQANFGQSATPYDLVSGDWDGDGRVGVFERGLVLTNWTDPLGDLNGDGELSVLDVSALVLALTDPGGYDVLTQGLAADVRGDFDGNGVLNNLDIFGFVEALSPDPAAANALLIAVPEPGSAAALMIAIMICGSRWRRGLSDHTVRALSDGLV